MLNLHPPGSDISVLFQEPENEKKEKQWERAGKIWEKKKIENNLVGSLKPSSKRKEQNIQDEKKEETNEALNKVKLKPVASIVLNGWRGLKSWKKTEKEPASPEVKQQTTKETEDKIKNTDSKESKTKIKRSYSVNFGKTPKTPETVTEEKKNPLKRSNSITVESKPKKRTEKYVIKIINFVAIKVIVEEEEEEQPLPRVRSIRKVELFSRQKFL